MRSFYIIIFSGERLNLQVFFLKKKIKIMFAGINLFYEKLLNNFTAQ